MQTLTEIRSLLASRGIRPKHRLGQNFLHDHNVLRKLVDAAGLGREAANDRAAAGGTTHASAAARGAIGAEPNADSAPAPLVLEVGPGTGALTELLLERGARVIACEIDRDMISILQERVMPLAEGRLTIIEGDCLDGKRTLSTELRVALAAARAGGRTTPVPAREGASFEASLARPDAARFRLVANLPYGSATPLIATLLTDHPECDGLFATIQREVADRLLAAPRTDAYGPISVLVSLLARGDRVMDVAPGCFWPAPDVTSSIVALRPIAPADRPEPLRSTDRVHDFSRFVTGVFSRRRKQLGSIIGRDRALPSAIDARQRPEELTPSQWFELWRSSN